ncbi:aldehyde dehydrogenase family protein [Delftia tsuruhatensis]|uniref:Aldehyde dehydrogenase n=1 Tax=Delftia tsuruhatensis TaxID=180282 RepID=A0AAX3SIH6_9BURK|nr:aldehyde dehydrogenase family protein [Delftia tsuruhatensis]WFF79820.1 aldehyde dehydrogenase family protein [Delftia tsuruhatensis]
MTQMDLHRVFELQYQASRAQVDVPLLVRRERLLRMQKLLDEHGPVLAAAVQADFGMRSPRLTEMVELFVLRNLLKHTLRHLARWSGRQRVRTPLMLMPGRGWIERQPLGVVGVISPWNYPVQLALGPAITALAAGNRVMLKPSELTPHTSAQLAALVGQFFAPEEFAVIEGDVSVATQFSGLHFDHLLFTGSTAVGRRVAQAAAAHLTPTTLELGGKSPCIVSTDCDLKEAALKIAHGKLVNAGQTCIAPDYVLLPRGQEAEFAEAFRAAVQRLFPRFAGNPDYAAILTKRHLARLRQMLRQAQGMGAHVEWMEDGGASQEGADMAWGDAVERQMAPALVFNATSQMQLMQEEIFGPILPVISYDRLDDVVSAINAGPRPLALYWFGRDEKVRDAVLSRTISGGVTVNDTLLHFAHENLPFGGVGDSGWGAYHSEQGFARLSHQKAVFVQSRWSGAAMLYPPYGAKFDRIMELMRRWL